MIGRSSIGAVALSIALLTVIVSGGAAAVSTGGAGDVSSGSGDQVDDSSASDEEPRSETVVAQVDDRLRVTNYSYDSDEQIFSVELTNRGETRSTLSITEAIERGSGSGSFGVKRGIEVYPGETTTVEISAAPHSDGSAGVMITTEQSLSRGTGTDLWVDGDGIQLVDGAASWRDVQIGAVVGILSTMLMTIVVAWHVVARQSIDYEEADLSA